MVVELISYKELYEENQRLKKAMQASIDQSLDWNNPHEGIQVIIQDMIDNNWGYPEGTPSSDEEDDDDDEIFIDEEDDDDEIFIDDEEE